jgi:hypothetical protein
LPQLPAENHLTDRRYVSVVLRLVLDHQGQLVHGEIVGDANTRPTRFRGWRGLTGALQTWLNKQDGTTEEPETPLGAISENSEQT